MTDRDWNELRNDFHQTTDAMIKRSGRSIIAVFDCEGDDQPFAYTIGNHLKGLPELLVIGGRRDEVVGLLNGLSEMMIKADMAFKDGQVVRIPGGFPFKLIRGGNIARTEYAVQAGEHFGHDDYTIMQVLRLFGPVRSCGRSFDILDAIDPTLLRWF